MDTEKRDMEKAKMDECPLFKEPHIEGPFVKLELCETSYWIGEKDFIDEREVSK